MLLCSNTGIFALALFNLLSSIVHAYPHQNGAYKKFRTVVTTDMEQDDLTSLIRYLLYTNEVDTQGIIYSSSRFHWSGDGKVRADVSYGCHVAHTYLLDRAHCSICQAVNTTPRKHPGDGPATGPLRINLLHPMPRYTKIWFAMIHHTQRQSIFYQSPRSAT